MRLSLDSHPHPIHFSVSVIFLDNVDLLKDGGRLKEVFYVNDLNILPVGQEVFLEDIPKTELGFPVGCQDIFQISLIPAEFHEISMNV